MLTDTVGWAGEVWLYATEGGAPKRLDEDLGRHGAVVWLEWSPQGDALAVAVRRDGDSGYTGAAGSDLWLVHPHGGPPRRLTDALVRPFLAPLWEPDGDGILCIRSASSIQRLDV